MDIACALCPTNTTPNPSDTAHRKGALIKHCFIPASGVSENFIGWWPNISVWRSSYLKKLCPHRRPLSQDDIKTKSQLSKIQKGLQWLHSGLCCICWMLWHLPLYNLCHPDHAARWQKLTESELTLGKPWGWVGARFTKWLKSSFTQEETRIWRPLTRRCFGLRKASKCQIQRDRSVFQEQNLRLEAWSWPLGGGTLTQSKKRRAEIQPCFWIFFGKFSKKASAGWKEQGCISGKAQWSTSICLAEDHF